MNILDKLSKEKCDKVLHCLKTSQEFEGIYSYVNGYSYNLLRKDAAICEEFDVLFSDGIYLIIFYNLFFRRKIRRYTFDMTSLAPDVFNYASKLRKRVYFLGGTPKEMEQFLVLIRENYPNLEVAGTQHGYSGLPEEALIDQILSVQPDLVIVGLGCPKQESFLVNLKRAGWKGIGFACGAFISQTQENLNYYPAWIDTLHLRWVYRLTKEKHTRKRFFKYYPIFPFVLIKDIIRFKFSKKNTPPDQN